MKPLFSVITLNWNRREDLDRTLQLILQQTYQPLEIIVVDNGSTDGSVEHVGKEFPDIRLIPLHENTGVEGYNKGIRNAKGEYILLIDNDMDLLQQDTLEKALEYFAGNPKLGAVALQVRLEDRTELSPNNPKFWEAHGDAEHGYPCSTFDGGGVALRSTVLQQVGLYTPEFFVYHSEVDLSTRIWDAGFEIRYFPAVAVSHRHSPVSRNPKAHTFYATRNYLWYVWIYYPFRIGLLETLHFLQRSFFQNVRAGKSLGSWARGFFAAVFGWRRVSHHRRPVKPETIRWMQQLRDEDRRRKERM
jgi:GT2 family glycosyltransferase